MNDNEQNLKSISECCNQAAFGGLIDLQYAPVDWIDSFPPNPELLVNNIINTAITLIAGKDWLSMGLLPESLDFKQTSKSTNQGNRHQMILSGEIPFLEKTKFGISNSLRRRTFEQMERRRFVIKITDTNGVVWILGDIQSPLEFISTEDIKKEIKGGHVLPFQFTGQHAYKIYEYEPE